MAQLSDDELRDAAAEAGISPAELRHALAVRDGTDLDRPAEATSVMGPPARGTAETFVEGRVAKPPSAALASVRGSIERQTGRSGHGQGDGEADIVDDSIGLNYRLRSRSDDAGGALVRVDVDPTSGRNFRNMFATGGVGATLILLGLAALFGSTMFAIFGFGVGALTAAVTVRRTAQLTAGIAQARSIASQALMEGDGGSDSPSPRALRPSD